MEIVYKSIDELTPYENNPRHNENAVAAVAASIKEFNFKVPLGKKKTAYGFVWCYYE